MIRVYRGEETTRWLQEFLSAGQQAVDPQLAEGVGRIIRQVAQDGDEALRALARQFGEEPPETFRLPDEALDAAIARLPREAKALLERAAENIRFFAEGVARLMQPVRLERPGYALGMDFRPVDRVACYVPGGRYPLPSTALMTAVTARAAGVPQVCIFSPKLGDEVLYAGHLAGVTEFYRVGGAQAVAAAAFGTQSIPRAEMLVGPGNKYVTEAKRQLQGVIGIDMLAGPSEVTIIADAGANAEWIALDMLAQSEHDPDARAFLLTDSEALALQVAGQLTLARERVSLPEYIDTSLANGAILVLRDLEACAAFANEIAPEHLQLHVRDPQTVQPRLRHYGALFIGDEMTVPFGDYLTGPNHTLPTNRTARFSGGLSPLTFLRPQSWVWPTGDIQSLARDTAQFAALEGLHAHAAAAQARLKLH